MQTKISLEWQNPSSQKEQKQNVTLSLKCCCFRVCTECKLILETKDKESEEIPNEEITQPAEPEQEEITLPEVEENPDNKTEEPAEEQGVLEQITEVFEKIADIFEDLFGFISGLFKF